MVQVDAEDLILVEQALDAVRQHRLADLAPQRALLADDQQLGHLLGNGRAALHDVAGAQVGPRRARDALIVDAAVRVETRVLGGHEGAANRHRDLRDRQQHPFLDVKLPDRLAVGAEDLAGAQRAIVGHGVEARRQIRFEGAIGAVCEEAAHGGGGNQRQRCHTQNRRENAAETCHSFFSFHYSSMIRRRFTVNLMRPSIVRFAVPAFVSVIVTVLVSLVAPRAMADTAPRERFVVVPFANQSGQRSLDFLAAGLPAVVAERLPRHPRLRFAGVSSLVEKGKLDEALARAAAGGTRWVVAGRYERRPDWKIQVTVQIFAPPRPRPRRPRAPPRQPPSGRATTWPAPPSPPPSTRSRRRACPPTARRGRGSRRASVVIRTPSCSSAAASPSFRGSAPGPAPAVPSTPSRR